MFHVVTTNFVAWGYAVIVAETGEIRARARMHCRASGLD